MDLHRRRGGGGGRSLEGEGDGNARRGPGSLVGQPLEPLLPREPRLRAAYLLAGKLESLRVRFERREPGWAEVVVDWLAHQAAHVQLQAVQFDARFRPDGSEQRGAGHEVIEGHGRRIGLQADDAANEAVFERDFAGIGAESCPGGEGLRINQPISRARQVGSARKGCGQQKDRKPE